MSFLPKMCQVQAVALILICFISSGISLAGNEKQFNEMLKTTKAIIGSEPDSAISLCTEVFQNTLVDSTKAKSAYFLGIAWYYKGMYRVSETYYTEALQCLFGMTNKPFRSKVLNNLGVIYDMTANYTKAIEAYLKSAEIDLKLGDSTGMMQSWMNIALLYTNMNQFRSALNYLEMTRGYFEMRHDTSGMALWNQNYGKMEIESDHPERSLPYLERAAELHKYSGNIYEYLNVLNITASVETGLDHYEKALDILKTVDKISGERNYSYLNKRSRLTLAETYMRQGDPAKAKETLLSIEDGNYRIEGKKRLLALALSIDQRQAATTLDKLRDFIFYNDSVKNLENEELVNEIHIRYESDKKAREIQYQHEKIQIQQKKLLASFFGLAALVVFSVTLLYLYFRLKKTYHILFENLKNSPEPYSLKEIKPAGAIPGLSHSHTTLPLTDTWDNILHVLKNEKLYLNPTLKLEDIAKACNTNKTYIYQAISEQTDDNFNTFINRFRVDEARKLMESSPVKGFDFVATSAGFNSKSNYYRTFKSITGLSPGQYQQYLVNEKQKEG